MTAAFFSDQAEKVLATLNESQARAVRSLRGSLEIDPRLGQRLPGNDPNTEEYVIRLSEQHTEGTALSVVYRYNTKLDGCMITWLIVGP